MSGPTTESEDDRRAEPAHQIPVLLRALSAGERRLATAVAQDMGLGATDLIALGDLIGETQLGPTELGRRLGLSSAAATGLADRLQALGHVQRRPHPQDRRRLVLAPTSRARTELAERLAPVAAGVEALVAGLTSAEQATIARFLLVLIDRYDEAAASINGRG